MATYSTQSQPLPYVVPYLQDYLSRAQNVANTPYTASPSTAPAPNDYLQQGWQAAANRATQGSPVMGAANTLATDTLNGQYLNSNPYLSSAIDSANSDLIRNYSKVNVPKWAQANAASGSYGNTGVAEAFSNDRQNLMSQIANTSATMRSNAYNTERGYQQQMAGLAPTLANQDYTDINALINAGTQAQGYQQAGADQNYKWWQEAQNYPAQRLAQYGNALGIGGQGQTSTQTTPDPSLGSQLLGGGLTGAAIYKIIFGGP